MSTHLLEAMSSPSLIRLESTPGGVLVVHVAAGVPSERRSAMLVQTLEPMPQEISRILLSFAAGTELCCTSLWALSGLSDRCVAAGGAVGICGLGERTVRTARETGLLRRFVQVDQIEQGIERLMASRSGKPLLRWRHAA